jgi:hypothetical protein
MNSDAPTRSVTGRLRLDHQEASMAVTVPTAAGSTDMSCEERSRCLETSGLSSFSMQSYEQLKQERKLRQCLLNELNTGFNT